MQNKNYFSLGEASKLLNIPKYKLTYLLETGKVKEPIRVGGKRLFTKTEINYIKSYLRKLK